MAFYKSPFLYITPLFIIGIILSSYYVQLFVILFALFGSVLVQLWGHFYLKNRLFYWSTACSFLLLGLGIGSFHLAPVNEDSLEGNQSFICVVKEFQKSNKNWKKGIVEIVKTKRDGAIKPHSETMLMYFTSNVCEGDVLLSNTTILKIQNKGNPGEFDAESYWKSKGIRRFGFIGENEFKWVGHLNNGTFNEWVKSTRATLSAHIDAYFNGDSRGIIKAILLGDKTDLSIEARNSFSKAGAMHVLAVSGLHVGIVMYLLLFVFSKFPRFFSKRTALILTICIVWLYAVITGMSPSVTRAALMFSILISGQVLSRQTNSINILFFSAFVMLMIDPNLLFDLGFQLSYLAVLGILLLQEPIAKMIYVPNKWIRKIWEGTTVGIAAQLATFPLILFHFHQFPNYFLLTNLVVMAVSGVILFLGLLFVLSKSFSFLTSALSALLGLVVNAFLFSIQFIESMPGSVAKGFELSALMVILLYFCLVVFYLFKRFKLRLGVSALLLVLLCAIQYGRFDRMTSNHVIFFNHNKPLIAAKVDDKIICFHNQDVSKITRLLDDYSKIFPGNISFQSLSKDKMVSALLGELEFSIAPQNDNWIFATEEDTVLLQSSYRRENNKTLRVSMSYLPEVPGEYNLKNGALIVPL